MSCLCPADVQLIPTVQAAFSDVIRFDVPAGPPSALISYTYGVEAGDRSPLVYPMAMCVGSRDSTV